MNPEPQPPASENRFDTLMALAKRAESQERLIQRFRSIWASFLELETWVFLTTGGSNPEQASPFIGIIDGKPWALAFTDPRKAAEFAGEDPRFRDSDGGLLFIAMPKMQALQWVLGLQQDGVAGIRINQGEFGWMAPLANLPAIIVDIEGQEKEANRIDKMGRMKASFHPEYPGHPVQKYEH